MYIVNQDWESEQFVYSDNEKEKLLYDLTKWLFENEGCYIDYVNDKSDCLYYDYCMNNAAETIEYAEIYGNWSVADLTVRTV